MSTEKEQFLSSLTYHALSKLPAVPAQPDFVDDKSSSEYTEEQAQWRADVEAARSLRCDRAKTFTPGTVLRLNSGEHYLVGDGWSCAACDTEPEAERVTHIAYLYGSPKREAMYVQNVLTSYHCVNDLFLTFAPEQVICLNGLDPQRVKDSLDLKSSLRRGYLVRAYPCRSDATGYTTVKEEADVE